MAPIAPEGVTGRPFSEVVVDGGARVAQVLEAQGVPFVFTLVGGHVSPILVGCERRGIRVVDVRDEVNTVFAADAVARLTGIPGVAIVTAGPGVTNTLTALKNAQMAQSPIVLIGGATATMLRGRGALQDIDQVSVVAPHVKYIGRPNSVREIVPTLERAFHEAKSGVPGPVFVELAVDLLYDESTVRDWYKVKTEGPPRDLADRAVKTYIKLHLANQFGLADWRAPGPAEPPNVPTHTDRDVSKAANLLAKAERPVAVLGSQVVLDARRVRDVAAAVERLGIPVYLSGMARGLLGADHPLQMRHKRRNALKEADLVFLFGVPNDFRLDYGSHISNKAKLVSVNRSADDLTKNRKPDHAVLADPGRFLAALSRAVGAADRGGWMGTLRGRDAGRDAEIAKMATDRTEYCNPLEVCLGIEKALSDDSVLVVDGGDFVATASYVVKPRAPLSWLDPGVFGTLGVGAGFALGAKLVRPSADVWLLWGDGSAGFSIMEFDTFVRHQVPIIAVVGNDAGWTQILRDQEPTLGSDVACRLRYTDYDKVAVGWGARGVRIDDPKHVDAGLSQAVELSRAGHPVCVNALIGKTDFRKGSISI